METLNNVATAAAKVIMGDSNTSKEPVSGAKGDVTRGEPYDAGNLETPGQQQVEKRLELGESGVKPDESEIKPSETATTATHAPSNGFHEKKDVEDAHKPEVKHEVEHECKPEGKPEDKPEDEDEPPSPKGPGPRPLPVVAKEHHGDAGRIDEDQPKAKSDESTEANPDATTEETSQAPAQEYVKSTGFAAEGGDFDATKPGAGREADRLLGKGATGHEDSETVDKHSSKSKPSLGERIKAKLHKH